MNNNLVLKVFKVIQFSQKLKVKLKHQFPVSLADIIGPISTEPAVPNHVPISVSTNEFVQKH